jgi:hypothetical protein
VYAGKEKNDLAGRNETSQQNHFSAFPYMCVWRQKCEKMILLVETQRASKIIFSHFFLQEEKLFSMKLRYNIFCTNSIYRRMILLLEDDVVMKRLFGWYYCVIAVD